MRKKIVAGLLTAGTAFALLTPQGGKITIHVPSNNINTKVEPQVREINVSPKYEKRITGTQVNVIQRVNSYVNRYFDSYYTRWLAPVTVYTENVKREIRKTTRPECLWWEGNWCVVYEHKYYFKMDVYKWEEKKKTILGINVTTTLYKNTLNGLKVNYRYRYNAPIKWIYLRDYHLLWKPLWRENINHELGIVRGHNNQKMQISGKCYKYSSEGWAIFANFLYSWWWLNNDTYEAPATGICRSDKDHLKSLTIVMEFLGGINSVKIEAPYSVPIKKIRLYGWTDDGWKVWINGKYYGQGWGGDEDEDDILEKADAIINVKENSVRSITVQDGGGADAFPMLKIAVSF
ncbi:MAG: hypothetical protein DSY42_01085 [Aquifex sp.]|nr:MAG: hypothetical protein DSY42_01085 [Aquifex sp.]